MTGGSNVIKFTDDTRPEDLKVSRDSSNVTMQIGDDGDRILLRSFMRNYLYNDFTLEFSDGTVMHVKDAGSPFASLF